MVVSREFEPLSWMCTEKGCGKRSLGCGISSSLKENDCYKTYFIVPFAHFEWNVIPFGVKIAPFAFQEMMNETFQHAIKAEDIVNYQA